MKKEAGNAKKTFKKTYDDTYNGLKIMEENQKEHRTEFIAKHIDTIMQCINDFSSSLRKDVQLELHRPRKNIVFQLHLKNWTQEILFWKT